VVLAGGKGGEPDGAGYGCSVSGELTTIKLKPQGFLKTLEVLSMTVMVPLQGKSKKQS